MKKLCRFRSTASIFAKNPRSETGIGEFDRVLGGGIVKGSVTLLSGEPGIGKSTLLLQICGVLSGKYRLLYVSGEESPSQIKLRAKRLGISNENILLYTETDINEILAEIGAVNPDIVIIDSIQTMTDSNSATVAGSITREKHRYKAHSRRQNRRCVGDHCRPCQ